MFTVRLGASHLSDELLDIIPPVKAELEILEAFCAINAVKQTRQLQLFVLTPFLEHSLNAPEVIAEKITGVVYDISSADGLHKLLWCHAHRID